MREPARCAAAARSRRRSLGIWPRCGGRASLDEERVWAIEDCRSCSRRLEQALLAAGERVVRVPPNRMGASRKGEREPGKSDEIDALAVAARSSRTVSSRFPVAYLNEQAMEIRLLVDHRNDLVAERTRTVNRLRWHLLELCPELEALAQAWRAEPGRGARPGRAAGCESCPPAPGSGSRASRSLTCAASTAVSSGSRPSWPSSSPHTDRDCLPSTVAAR